MSTCSTTDYLIHCCQGYQVFSAEGHIGFVVEVVDDPDGRATTIVVRVGRFVRHAVTVPAEAVDSVDPVRERVVVAPLVDEPCGESLLLAAPAAV